jgi:6-phosphogluconate dehydrogenase (decarboxylating)
LAWRIWSCSIQPNWLMVPSAVVDQTLAGLVPLLAKDDAVIDGGNSQYNDDIRRAAQGSDNWPLAWADDDALYGAYGDGNGFKPFLKEKLSMGFAKITGGPTDFTGVRRAVASALLKSVSRRLNF